MKLIYRRHPPRGPGLTAEQRMEDTGFATLASTQIGGDCIGMDPIFLQLPSSGILVQFTARFGLNNANGGGNKEHGSTPDIVSPTGETPLW